MRRKQLLVAAGLLAATVVAGGLTLSEAFASNTLVQGWNNVGYYGAAKPPPEALDSIDGKYNAVYRWNAQQQKYDLYAPDVPGFVSTLNELNTGDAIWVNMTSGGGTLPSLNLEGGVAPTSGTVSVAASTFLPMNDLAIYEKGFNELYPVGTDLASQRYFAPVVLPHGASVTSMTAAFEASGGNVQLRLDYTPLSNGNNNSQIFKLAEVLSTSGASPQTAEAFPHTVDNAANVYFLVVDLTGGPGTKLRGVSIAYDVD
jgi:hypothetical protein